MRLILSTLAACLVLSAPALGENSGPEKLQERFVKAVLNEDLEALGACYTEDATSYPIEGMAVAGRQAIRDSWAPLFADFDVTELALLQGHHREFGDAAVAWGLFKMTFVPKAGGDPIVMEGRYTDMSRKMGDEWLYIFDHASVPLAPPAE